MLKTLHHRICIPPQ